MTMEAISTKLKTFIAGELLLNASVDIEDDDQLLVDGYIDSLGAIRLVDFVERTWELRVPPLDVNVDNFGTIQLIAQYVETHGKEGPPPE